MQYLLPATVCTVYALMYDQCIAFIGRCQPIAGPGDGPKLRTPPGPCRSGGRPQGRASHIRNLRRRHAYGRLGGANALHGHREGEQRNFVIFSSIRTEERRIPRRPRRRSIRQGWNPYAFRADEAAKLAKVAEMRRAAGFPLPKEKTGRAGSMWGARVCRLI